MENQEQNAGCGQVTGDAVNQPFREKDLQILLAWQAFLFNNRNAGFAEDADVFSALYEVSKRYGNKYYSRFSPDGAS